MFDQGFGARLTGTITPDKEMPGNPNKYSPKAKKNINSVGMQNKGYSFSI
jgi:dihydroorotate dehydrogenase